MFKTVLLTAFVSLVFLSDIQSQESSSGPSIGIFTGLTNYQGDLNPNSFTYRHSRLAAGIIFRQPINRWFALRAGLVIGKLQAADRYNRDYLKKRNLSFYTSLKELHAGVEFTLLDISRTRFTPYMYGGIAVFHFNPWAKDINGKKTYLHPLSTEGQGLAEFPEQKPYQLTQFSLPFGGGFRFAVSDAITVGIEISQRKSFTDYIDDVSSHYVSEEILLNARGAKAVEMAYRGNQVPGGVQGYPNNGDQRGTPKEMDWYYFFGTTVEIKLDRIGDIFGGRVSYQQRCPRNVGY